MSATRTDAPSLRAPFAVAAPTRRTAAALALAVALLAVALLLAASFGTEHVSLARALHDPANEARTRGLSAPAIRATAIRAAATWATIARAASVVLTVSVMAQA